jgi:low temperature requirement protein LtrA
MPALTATKARFLRPMRPRDPDEEHRAATPLELFFDLCFVAAVSIAAESLHHALVADDIGDGLVSYAVVFFAIWWAWMNFTWFASAYDTDDLPYRLITLLQVAGVLILAAGLPRAFDESDFAIVVAGYVIMRLAMVAQWLRAARNDPERRRAALRYATGLVCVQVLWVALLFVPEGLWLPGWAVLAAVELALPVWAEHFEHTTWHPHHIAERYGLFTLIVLGESIISTTRAFQVALDEGQDEAKLISLAIAAIVIIFAMWWLYFDRPAEHHESTSSGAFIWGYGHYFIFAAIAANGAGLAAAIDIETHHSVLGAVATSYTVAAPVAVYLLGLWAIQLLKYGVGLSHWPLPLGAAFILLAPLSGLGVYLVAALIAAVVTADTLAGPQPSTPLVDVE